MRFVCFGDIHMAFGAIARLAPELAAADVAILTGDLTNFGDPPDALEIVEAVRRHCPTVLAVTGNLDMPTIIEAFRGVNVHILVQEFIEEAQGADIRCFVIGNKVVASMMRQSVGDDFRSNLHRGGSGEAVRITPQERSAAVRAARTLGLNVCGVDMLRSKAGPLVVELNSSPGIEGLEKATGVDVATAMIEFLERNAAPGHTRTKGKG